jgi:two-component system response regulator YesN
LLPGEVYHVQEIRQGLIQAFRDLIAQRVPQTLSPKLNQAIRYMNEHYMEDIGIDEVADAVGISVSYLHQLFKKDLNRTFLDCLTEIRIRKAQHILLHEDAKMFEVSERVGYRSPQHFSQVFKRMTGMSPHEFREGRLS